MELLLSSLALVAVIVFALAFGMYARESMAQVSSMTRHVNELQKTMSENTVRVDGLKELVLQVEEKAKSADRSSNDVKSDLKRLKGKVDSLSEELESWRERT
jgi:peptidoglycan hydrolase CwlO-like protein